MTIVDKQETGEPLKLLIFSNFVCLLDTFLTGSVDFTPSHGSTPLSSIKVGTPRIAISPIFNRSIYGGKPRVFNEPIPLQRSLSSSANSPAVDVNGIDSSAPLISPTTKKKMTLADLFCESTGESQQDESTNHEDEVETSKSSQTASNISGSNSESSCGKRTPTQTKLLEEELLKSAHCCFPCFPSARGFKKTLFAAPPPMVGLLP